MPSRNQKQTPKSSREWLGSLDLLGEVTTPGWLLSIALFAVPFLIAMFAGGYSFAEQGSLGESALRISLYLIWALFVLRWFLSWKTAHFKKRYLRAWTGWSTACLATLPLSGAAYFLVGIRGVDVVICCLLIATAVLRAVRLLMRLPLLEGRPALTLGTSFALLILFGACSLYFEPGATHEDISFADALFTSTSAVCVTGLESVSTLDTYTGMGHAIILFLFQLGGLGIMTLGTFLLLSAGYRLGIGERRLIQHTLNSDRLGGMAQIVASILGVTLFFEAIGAALLYPFFKAGDSPIFNSIFHSVSAFCNAGFALRNNSLGDFRIDYGFNIIAASLIILGGLGFGVINEIGQQIYYWLRGQSTKRRLPIHARLVMWTSLVLIILGAVSFWLLERDGVLARHTNSGAESALVSVFHSVSMRTAGFATVDFAASANEPGLSASTKFMMLPFMLIGASPGSTGGGFKTVTLIVMLLGIISLIRNRDHAEVYGRRLPDDLVKKAGAVVFLYVVTLFVAVLGLLISDGENFALSDIMFEATSAVGTVGYSVGISSHPDLSTPGQLILTALMFIGRLGPLTLILSTAASLRGAVDVRYPEERVIIG